MLPSGQDPYRLENHCGLPGRLQQYTLHNLNHAGVYILRLHSLIIHTFSENVDFCRLDIRTKSLL